VRLASPATAILDSEFPSTAPVRRSPAGSTIPGHKSVVCERSRGRQNHSHRAPDRGAEDESDDPPSPSSDPRGTVLVIPQPLKFDLRKKLAEPVADRSLDFAFVIRGSGTDGWLAKRNFNQEARWLYVRDLDFEDRVILCQHDVTSSMQMRR
jgi:hypothetical protein